ncbi:MAG TPA: HAD-IA family hydrolase [Acidimicrobiales bacterium]|jgi:sugar-phosphatase
MTPPGGGSPAFGAAIFDMDGLLVDSEPLWREAEIDIFGRLGVPLTEQLCLETRGMVLTEVTRHWFDRHGWDGPDPDAVAAEIIDAMEALLSRSVAAKPGVVPALASCRARGMRLAVASSSPRRLVDAVVDRLRLRPWFDVLHSAENEPAGKPDPAVFLTTAEMLGMAPDRCVVFEDSPAGIQAAVAAGMACVAVPEDGVATDMAAHQEGSGFERADLVIGSLEDVDDAFWARIARRRPSRSIPDPVRR